MASKRLKKKRQKQAEIQTLEKQGISKKQASKLTTSQRQQKIEKAQKSKKKYSAFKDRVYKKRTLLAEQGFSEALEKGFFSDKKIDSIKIKDIEKGYLPREKYSFLFFSDKFDFNRVLQFKDGKRMYIAFLDMQGELDFADILADFSRYSNAELITFLDSISGMRPTYSKSAKTSSSGRAGSYRYMLANQNVISSFNRINRAETEVAKRNRSRQKAGKKTKRRHHYTGDNVGYQVLKDGNRVSHDKVTPRNLLIIANSIMYNVTEDDRVVFYRRFYRDITKHFPELREIFPLPKF